MSHSFMAQEVNTRYCRMCGKLMSADTHYENGRLIEPINAEKESNTMSETEVMEQETAEVAGRKYTALTNEQKQAATYRRDASLLRKYGNDAKAAELEAQADAIAPARAKQGTRVDPLQVLTNEEQSKLMNYFKTTKQGFANIAKHVSAAKLAAIAAEV